jgi:hypothetical protein
MQELLQGSTQKTRRTKLSVTKPQPGTPEFLTAVRKAISYDAMNGVLRWVDGGGRAGVSESGEWRSVLFQGRRYYPEIFAWLIQTGDLLGLVGFRNGINTDLRWSNLFDATAQQEVTVVRAGDLFVLRNGDEQVIVSPDLDEVLRIAGDVLRGGAVAEMKERQ